MNKFLLTIFSFGCILAARGQSVEELTSLKQMYESDEMVFVDQHQHLRIFEVNGELDITTEHESKIAFLSENSAVYNTHAVSYTSFSEIEELNAYSLVRSPNGKKLNKVEVENFDEVDVRVSGIFYNDLKKKEFVFPGIEPLSYGIFNYKERIKEPQFLTKYFFDSYKPVLNSQFMITVSKNVKITYRLFGEGVENITYEMEEREDVILHKWEMKNIMQSEFEPNAPHYTYYSPHLIVNIESFEADGEKKNVLNGLEGLYNWYYSFVEEILKENDPQIEEIVNNVVDGTEDDKEKFKRIFYWVQDNIKYIAFEDGFGGFIPRKASEVCSKRYGDCKDMSVLLYQMCRSAGLKAHLAWIGSRKLPYTYSNNPTPFTDNHMVCMVELENEWTMLDATSQFLQFGYPSSMTQGKEALVGLDDSNYKIVKVQEIAKDRNSIKEVIDLVLNDGILTGTGKKTYSGYKKTFLNFNLLSIEDNSRKENVRNLFLKGNNKFKLEDFEILNKNDRDSTTVLNYTFTLEDYAKQIADEIYINLNLNRNYKNWKLKKDRMYPREFDFKFSDTEWVRLKIPENFTVDYMPKSVTYESPSFGFSLKYYEKDGHLVLERNFHIDELLIGKELFDQWNEMIDKMIESGNEAASLTKRS